MTVLAFNVFLWIMGAAVMVWTVAVAFIVVGFAVNMWRDLFS